MKKRFFTELRGRAFDKLSPNREMAASTKGFDTSARTEIGSAGSRVAVSG